MLALVLIIMFLYVVNTTIILQHASEVGRYDIGDLLHTVLGPLTLVTVMAIKLASHLWDLETPLWQRK
jgi:uncharacterized protein (UPF0212 family)